MPIERSWDFHEWGFGPDEYSHFHRIAVMEHDMFRTMPVIEGAADALWRLSDAGIWIRIITHRLYVHWGHEKAIADTAAWLDANKIPYRDLCFLGAKPQVEADAYIDDAPHNIRAAAGRRKHRYHVRTAVQPGHRRRPAGAVVGRGRRDRHRTRRRTTRSAAGPVAGDRRRGRSARSTSPLSIDGTPARCLDRNRCTTNPWGCVRVDRSGSPG